jgi:hypothetical protein
MLSSETLAFRLLEILKGLDESGRQSRVSSGGGEKTFAFRLLKILKSLDEVGRESKEPSDGRELAERSTSGANDS